MKEGKEVFKSDYGKQKQTNKIFLASHDQTPSSSRFVVFVLKYCYNFAKSAGLGYVCEGDMHTAG
jgi:hypothetical protein